MENNFFLYLIPLAAAGVLACIFRLGSFKYLIDKIAANNKEDTGYKNTYSLAFSLIAMQLTVTTGIFASLSALSYYGYFFLIAPFSFFLGFILLYFVNKRYSKETSRPIIFEEDSRHSQSSLHKSYLSGALLVGVFLIGWEFFVLSEFFVSFFQTSNLPFFLFLADNSIIIVFLLAGIMLFYMSGENFDQVVRTDIVQFVGILIFVIMIVGYLWFKGNSVPLRTVETSASTFQISVLVCAVILINLFFPFVNPGMRKIVSQSGSKLPVILTATCVFLLLFFVAVVYIFKHTETANVAKVMAQPTYFSAWLVALTPLFTWSTADTQVNALSQLANSLMPIKDTEWRLRAEQAMHKRIPIIIVLCALSVSLILESFRPDLFQSLVGATGALSVFGPFLLFRFLKPKSELIRSKRIGYVALSLFGTAFILGISFPLIGLGPFALIPTIVVICFAICFLFEQNHRRENRKNKKLG